MTLQMTVYDLPDYPALARLASALWNDGQARGAAILVGAGFSRNAELAGSDTKLPPLWSDLRDAMATELYHDHISDAPQDALRLAEEYRIYLGSAALVELLREQIPDAAWRPGTLHRELMALPWADVLTTNYDTLLERASDREVVRDASDLAQVRGPRVIKLHGSIDGTARLVITEEDYRTYPVRSAAFVNTARQVFLENELCLLGFSGDDPNFLQWSGWVRDNLGEGARRIYLVGSLGLNPAKRRLLESRNVVPIDFAQLTGGLSRGEAERHTSELFITYLASRKPSRAMDWEPADHSSYKFMPDDFRLHHQLLTDPATAVPLLEQLTKIWQTDASSCPNWLVMPKDKRQMLAFGTARAPRGFTKALGFVPVSQRVSILTLAARRAAISLDPIDDDLESALAALATGPEELPSSDRIELLRILLRESRQNRAENRFLEVEALLAKVAAAGSDAYADLVAQRLLWARDGLDLQAVSDGLAALHGPDPMWRIIRAALHCECGETELAKSLIAEIRNDLGERQRMDKASMLVASRRAWAEVFAGALRMSVSWRRDAIEPSSGVAVGYEAEEEIERLHREVRAKRLRNSEELTGLQPLFGPGAYQDHGLTMTYESTTLGYEAETVFRLADTSCVPMRIENVDIMTSLARDALGSAPLPTLQWHMRLLRVMRSSSPALELHFGTVSVARLDPGVAAELTTRVLAAMQFWQPRARSGQKFSSTFAVERLRLLIEVMSRLVVRAEVAATLEAFRFGRQMAIEPAAVHYWLHEPLGNLLSHSLRSLPPTQRAGLVLECLELPFPPAGQPIPYRWPDPTTDLFELGSLPGRPTGDPRWVACVSRLLAAVGEKGAARTQATTRLAYLVSHGSLDMREREEFGHLLWLRRDDARGGLPADVDLYPHVIATLPGTPTVDPVGIVGAYLFKVFIVNDDNVRRLMAVSAAAQSRVLITGMLPTHDQAIALLDGLAATLHAPMDDDRPFRAEENMRLLVGAGRAVGDAILRCLEPGDLTEQRLAFVNLCASVPNGGRTLAGFHELARLLPELTTTVAATLKRAISRGGLREIEGAARSIGDWVESTDGGRYPLPPEALKDAVIATVEVGVRQGLQPRLGCVRRLLEAGALSSSQTEALHGLLPELWVSLAYDVMPREGPEAIGITLARAECVKLARGLAVAGYSDELGIVDASSDPLPEVRYTDEATG